MMRITKTDVIYTLRSVNKNIPQVSKTTKREREWEREYECEEDEDWGY